MSKIKAIILSGYGLNCEEETKHAFELAKISADIIHINDLISNPALLKRYQIVALPGGFSYGDDTGSGNAFANKLRNKLWREIKNFVRKDKLVIGICNGFQILVNLGLLPAVRKKYGTRQVALLHNDSARYINRWVDVKVESAISPWLRSVTTLSLPIAHGEGKFYADVNILQYLNDKKLIALRYYKGEICQHQNLPANPNGALDNIAGITDESGRMLGMMPHPERATAFTHLPHWTYLKEQYRRSNTPVPTYGPGIQLFWNAFHYFSL